MHIQKKKILVCPLNWGLGHAARDVVIIQRLLDLGHEVAIAGDGASLEFLRQEFPEGRFLDLKTPEQEHQKTKLPPSWVPEAGSPEAGVPEAGSPQLEVLRFPSIFRIRYSHILPAWLKITLLSPFMLCEILIEHFRLARIIQKIGPDIVISDNRYGLWNRRVKSILITHQLSIRLPGFLRIFEYPISLGIKIFIRKFDQCWIPDYPDEPNLSGELSHRYKLPQNAVFIGVVSRFEKDSPALNSWKISPAANSLEDTPSAISGEDSPTTVSRMDTGLGNNLMSESKVPTLDLLILLSGPEPQRSRLQKTILKQVVSLESNCVILQGIPGKVTRTDLTSTVTMYNHFGASELKNMLISARYIICRSGYTGIMDLAKMRKKALIIPTPGQTEQEYLSEYLEGKGMFLTCGQDELNLESAINDLSDFNPVFNLPSDDLLENEIAKLSL